jgi:undecaprenyl-diphosphatase
MATILGGMGAGLAPAAAVEFSFYLAIPTILGATVLKLRHYGGELTSADVRTLAVGSLFALFSALAVVRWFLRYVSRERMTAFAVYRVVLGCAVAAWWLLRRGA